LQYEVTIRKILEFLDLDAASVGIPSPRFAQSADDISEEWSQQFRLPITIYAGLSLKFFGLSEIRSHSPYFQAKLEASRPMQGVMSYFESRNYALGGRPVTAKVLVS